LQPASNLVPKQLSVLDLSSVSLGPAAPVSIQQQYQWQQNQCPENNK
jgi:hypothetical protein